MPSPLSHRRASTLEIDTSHSLLAQPPPHVNSPLTSTSVTSTGLPRPESLHTPMRSASVSSPFGFPLSSSSLSSSRRRPANLVLSLPPLPYHAHESTYPKTAAADRLYFPTSIATNTSPAGLYTPVESPMMTSFPFSSIYGSDNDDLKVEKAYPSGPVEVYADNIFLYSEPSICIASQFDVVINVAREVSNPFADRASFSEPVPPETDTDMPLSPPSITSSDLSSPVSPVSIAQPPIPQRNSQSADSALHEQCCCVAADNDQKTPEYISIPWEHTSRLTQDLPYLTSVMARRASEGKKILVHCQCGVSRSASLVVAFVMKERGWDLNQAYAWVKRKAPAIGPNMGLIYQLMEWGRILNGADHVDLTPREEDEDFVGNA
ncbi:dual specificity phosphatase [Lipomyces doorenjongii]|uniref:dual specificity phosphatase n=1 Tax=Lipomyces doorenjongii TaxID=383834 RepID=UPI0034CF2510